MFLFVLTWNACYCNVAPYCLLLLFLIGNYDFLSIGLVVDTVVKEFGSSISCVLMCGAC